MENISNIIYKKPEDNLEEIRGKKVGSHEITIVDPDNPENWRSKVNFEYVSRPLPHYYLHTLDTDLAERGQRYASKVMDEFEALLHKTKRLGFLEDGIELNDPAYGMYERRGWRKLDEHGIYMFDPRPGHYSEPAMQEMINRYT